jgi:hypothetical protein
MGPCKDAHLSDDLQSLISRKLSMAVRTERITHLLPSGDLGSSLDKEGNWGPEHEMSMDRARAEMALNLLREKGGDVGDEFAIRLRITLLCVVEENTYTIRDQKVKKYLMSMSTLLSDISVIVLVLAINLLMMKPKALFECFCNGKVLMPITSFLTDNCYHHLSLNQNVFL